MALDISPEQKELGKRNFQRTVSDLSVSRRDFMKGLLAGTGGGLLTAAAYFGYQESAGVVKKNPVKAGLIGSGDEGGVLVGEHNPEYLQFIAYSDIRPYNQKRIFTGEPSPSPRRGFNHHYGKDADKKIKFYEDYRKLLENKDIEAVVIALPLHLHAPVAIDCMKAGKHVLCEKLMAWNVSQCKEMIKVADETDRCLSIGHQRHYSMLYAHGVEVLRSGVLGDVKHIRALWHRNNSWPKVDPKTGTAITDAKGHPVYCDGWYPEIRPDKEAWENRVKEFGYKSLEELIRKEYGYKSLEELIRKEYGYKSLEELIRWRLYNRTGGGLMAELGSHQLDACSIFLGKVHPLAVTGIGTRSFYRDQYREGERECDDHVFVTFEFPGTNYSEDKDDVVVVTYSSVNTNSFESYGECVMGTRGTMVVEMEQNIQLYMERDPNNRDSGSPRSTAVTVTATAAGKPALDATSSQGGAVKAGGDEPGSKPAGPISRGYREEMEHFACCVRLWNEGSKADRQLPRCHGRVAMADAIIALTSNLAMKHRQRIEFKEEWFDAKSLEVPDKEMIVT
jgi:predicted dehydrogenase